MRNSYFVNLPLRHIHRNPSLLSRFISDSICPELGLDPLALDRLDVSFFEDVAGQLNRAGLACSIHLPFFDLQPGSLDDYVLEATRRRLVKAWEVSRLFDPSHLVGHVQYNGVYVELYDEWLARSLDTWRLLGQEWADHPPLYLENTHESAPKPVRDVVVGLGSERVKVCFDTGHWFSFSGGSRHDNLGEWMQVLGGLVGHLHLHDNDGSADQHLGMGRGRIPFGELFAWLSGHGVRPGVTLEPHTEEDLAASLAWIGENGLPLAVN